MKKILVPTDFSQASKSSIRFAIQWASQQKLQLVFIHVIKILVPTRWSEDTAKKHTSGEIAACRISFKKFIETIYSSMAVKPATYDMVIIPEHDPAKSILEYCLKRKFDCICISTNGAGPIMKLFGTNTSKLIAKSPIPVLAIPKNYKPKQVKNILYATDFTNYKNELKKVLHFASGFNAAVDIIHFVLPGKQLFDVETFKKRSGDYEFGLNIGIEESYLSLPMGERLQKIILKRKPSVVILFTQQERNFLQKLLRSSKSEELSYQLKTPLLVFSKMTNPSK